MLEKMKHMLKNLEIDVDKYINTFNQFFDPTGQELIDAIRIECSIRNKQVADYSDAIDLIREEAA